MTNFCPTCSHDLPIVSCAKCAVVADNQTLNQDLEPTGWGWTPDPRGPIEVEVEQKRFLLPRKVMVCDGCRFPGRG